MSNKYYKDNDGRNGEGHRERSNKSFLFWISLAVTIAILLFVVSLYSSAHAQIDVDTSNIQDQWQWQLMDQGNQQTIDFGDGGRSFHNPPVVTYPNTPSYFGPPMPSGNFMRVATVLQIKKVWTRTEIEDSTKFWDMEVNTKVIVKGYTETGSIEILMKKPENVILIGQINAYTNEDGDSMNCLASMAEEAMDIGGDILFITTEGAGRDVKSWGMGIGMHYSYASLHGKQHSNGSVGSGGTGISWGRAGYVDLPWIQGVVLKKLPEKKEEK